MPFPYYSRLSRSDQAIYRASDAVTRIELPEALDHAPLVRSLEAALASDDRAAVERAASRLVGAIARALSVEKVSVRVPAVRPRSATEELHGLYEREEDEVAVIRVWMRTARNERVVAFRTFLRTLMHELCHHLDYELLELADSFHTEGFFRRESSLVRALAGESSRGRGKGEAKGEPKGESSAKAKAAREKPAKKKPEQLALF